MNKTKLSDHFQMNQKKSNFYFPSTIECEILVNNQKRKTYGKNKNKIYLNNGDYIQIQIFNPLYDRIGVQLNFNGLLEEKMLIVNPGQKVLLDRFVDTKKKIKFSTYFIDGNDKKSKLAIEKNGDFIIHFWKEKQTFFTTNNYWSVGIKGPQGCSGSTGFSNSTGGANTSISGGVNTTGSDFLTSGTNLNSRLYDKSEIETGRLEKGEKSKQKMEKVEFNSDCIFQTLKFKLLPFSQMKKKTPLDNLKPKTVSVDYHNNYKNTDFRIYCSNPMCGYRVRNRNWKFCPVCGKNLE